jgi:hypothetical protein
MPKACIAGIPQEEEALRARAAQHDDEFMALRRS